MAHGIRHYLRFPSNPAQLVVMGFATLIAIGTLLLRLPWAADSDVPHPGWVDSLFWATSATTVTGLGTSSMADWSAFGEVVLLVMIQLGGFGIMTIGSLLALVASQRVGLRQRMFARAEIGDVSMGDVRGLLGSIGKITFTMEATIALILFIKFATYDDISTGRALYSGIYHSISAFNNAGISLQTDSIVQYQFDPVIVLALSFSFIIGGIGFPVWVEMGRQRNWRRWSLNTRVVLAATAFLLVAGPLVVLVFEWTNPDTLGPMSVPHKLLNGWFQGVTPRTAGFNSVDMGALREPTANIMTGLMFIGAGPASTGGGIKVTTFAILGFVMWAEIRGDEDVNVFYRRLSPALIRLAMTVALLAVGSVFAGAIALTTLTPYHLSDTLYEAASAFSTVGLSRGITPGVGTLGKFVLIAMMFAGRVGPTTFASAIALKRRPAVYQYATERPIIG